MYINKKFSLDGRPDAVQINIVSDNGLKWINVMNTNWFGLGSSAWTGRKKKQGLRRQAAKILKAANQHTVDGRVPGVIFTFQKVVSREVADALIAMGAEVEGRIVEAGER